MKYYPLDYNNITKFNLNSNLELPYSILNNQLQQTLTTFDVPISTPFPEPDPKWYYEGLPGFISEELPDIDGNVIDYVAVPWYSKIDISEFNYVGGPSYIVGYADRNFNPIVPPFKVYNTKRGDIVYYTFFSSDYMKTLYPETNLNMANRWFLLSDFGGIEAGSTASQTVQLSYGFNESQTESFSREVGASIQGSGLEGLLFNLSAKVTKSFSTTVAFSQNLTISTTVNYSAQPRNQRIGIYQYYSDYSVVPGPDFIRYSNNANNDSSQAFAPILGRRPPYTYTSNRFQKVFVLEPEN